MPGNHYAKYDYSMDDEDDNIEEYCYKEPIVTEMSQSVSHSSKPAPAYKYMDMNLGEETTDYRIDYNKRKK